MARSGDLARQLDSIAGRALALALPRRDHKLPATPAHIVFIQPTAIGDTLIASGAVKAIAERYSAARVTICHGASNGSAARMLAAPVATMEVAFTNPAGATRAIRSISPDVVIDLTPWPYATALVARLSAPFSVGFDKKGNVRARFFNFSVPHLTSRHEIENLAALAAAFGCGHEEASRMAVKRDAAALPRLRTDDLVLFHVSAGGARAADKSWPPEFWRTLAALLGKYGWRIGFTGTANDKERVDPIISAIGRPECEVFSLCGTLTLAELAELLAVVPLLVSVDTGVLHLSAAVDGVAIGLHGPTRAERWGSVSPNATGLDAPHPAGGYIDYGWESHRDGHAVMRTITPDRVSKAALEKLAHRSRH